MTTVQSGVETVTLTVDGFEVTVPKGTLIIRAAEQLGIQIPRFCDHPLLDPVGACRQCIVEVEGQRKPVASCTVAVSDGMAVRTQLTSKVADKAQQGTMELLLINHPLDCPICDKGGECPLQNQAMSNGRADSRFHDVKRTFPKPLAISSQVLLDRERCVLCARCTRFSQQVAGDPFIELFERGALEQVAVYEDEPFESYFSGNTVQICPVGALTGAAYRFRARPFDLMSTPSVCEHCASGCAQRTDWRRGKVMRRLAGEDPAVNEEWNCDKGRWAFTYATEKYRILAPLVRDEISGELVGASWPEALDRAAEGLAVARDTGGVGVLTGGRLTVEDAFAYASFALDVLRTNDVDMRARAHSAEEADFLAAHVAGRAGEVTYADLDAAPAVLLVAFEPEEESPIVFLRLRKAVRRNGLRVFSIAPFASRGTTKLSGTLIATPPGAEATVLGAITDRTAGGPGALAAEALLAPGAVILVGERAAEFPGALSQAAALADATGAKLAWIPRRAGERGAIEAGLLPGPAGRDTSGILTAAREGQLGGLLVGGVDPADLPDPAGALAALDAVGFVVSLELRHSAVTERADVVLPVAPAVHKSGTYLTWEGRRRPFVETLRDTGALSDARVLDALGDLLGRATNTVVEPRSASTPDLRPGSGDPVRISGSRSGRLYPDLRSGEAVLSSWRMLLDLGSLQDGEEHLAGTARRPVARLSPATAAELDAVDGDHITVTGPRGAITLPLVVTVMPERVVWVPMRSTGSHVRAGLGAAPGEIVAIAKAVI